VRSCTFSQREIHWKGVQDSRKLSNVLEVVPMVKQQTFYEPVILMPTPPRFNSPELRAAIADHSEEVSVSETSRWWKSALPAQSDSSPKTP
jgi:hypothetical protein